MNWKIYDNRLGSWSWRLEANAKEGPMRDRPMTTAWEAVILGDHHIKVILNCLWVGQLSLEIKI